MEEKRIACSADPKSEECKKAKSQVTNILEKIKIFGHEQVQEIKQERENKKQAIKERKERIKAEKQARNAERKKRRAEWKKACLDDAESKACNEGKPSEKIKNVLKKIEKKLGG